MSRTAPNPERILACAQHLARDLHRINISETDLRDRIEHVLWGKKQAWSFLEDGIVSELELRDLLIDHIDYECAHLSGKTWVEFDAGERQAIIETLDDILFGRPAKY